MSSNSKKLPDRTVGTQTSTSRSEEVSDLIDAVKGLLIPFIRAADEDAGTLNTGHGLSVAGGGPRTALIEHHKPQKLEKLLALQLPEIGAGRTGLLQIVRDVLQYSVNTWDPGFLGKLYASTDAVGVVSELVLAVLNTNIHVYQVSPALTVIEKSTTKALASLFGLTGPHAGGVSVQGGSASNTTSIVIARNTLFPDTKEYGNFCSNRKLILFTSAHGHYSIERAAQMLGFGSSAVWSVPTDSEGCMVPSELETLITKAKSSGHSPFYVNATAGTTVLGSFDPLHAIAAICTTHSLWLHVDASWGGPAIFSKTHAHKLAGSHLANSITINPHKMMGVPLTCSFLLAADLRAFHKANTLPAAYLFHSSESSPPTSSDTYDLADLTLQCGRRGDALKLALGWTFYGRAGYAAQIDRAFDTAAYMASSVAAHPDLQLVSTNPPPCLQVCFYYSPGGKLCPEADGNTKATRGVVEGLVREGFMIDWAPGEKGGFLRAVVNRGTVRGTVDGLLKAVIGKGGEVMGGVHEGSVVGGRGE